MCLDVPVGIWNRPSAKKASFLENALCALRISSLEAMASPLSWGGKLMVKEWNSVNVLPSCSGVKPAFNTTLKIACVAHCHLYKNNTKVRLCLWETRDCKTNQFFKRTTAHSQRLSLFDGQRKDWEEWRPQQAVLGALRKETLVVCSFGFPTWTKKLSHRHCHCLEAAWEFHRPETIALPARRGDSRFLPALR